MIEATEIGASNGIVATGPAEGARAGAQLYRRGGNVFDAAEAVLAIYGFFLWFRFQHPDIP